MILFYNSIYFLNTVHSIEHNDAMLKRYSENCTAESSTATNKTIFFALFLFFRRDVEQCIYEQRTSSSVLPVEAEQSLDFYLEPQSQSCVSLFDSFFSFSFRVTYDDGTPLADGEKVCPIPYLLNTAFKSVRYVCAFPRIRLLEDSCYYYFKNIWEKSLV